MVHWVRVANRSPDPLTVHDREVTGHWERMEEQWKENDTLEGSSTYPLRVERTVDVLQQLVLMLAESLSELEKTEAYGIPSGSSPVSSN